MATFRDDHRRRHERIDAAASKRGVSFERRTHEGFSGNIEGRIEKYRNPAPPPIGIEQRGEARSHFALKHLNSGCSVDMGDCSQSRPPLGPHGKDTRHETPEPKATGRQVEILSGRLGKY